MHHPQSYGSRQMKNNQTNKSEQVHAGIAGNGIWVVQEAVATLNTIQPRRFCLASLPLLGIIVSLK